VQATVATPQQLADLLGVLSAHVNRTASPDMFRVLGELELSFTQMKALFVLSEREQMSLKDVAGHLSMSLAAMSRAVDGLVQRGYLARSESASDRRSRLLTLLPAGRDVLGRVMSARASALVQFASELPDDERNALHAALLPIAERISRP
jgi:DNA-binding MarR family transcriptional regulator